MRNPFRKRDHERVAEADRQKRMQEWDARLRQIEETLANLASKYPQVIIEHVVIQQPVLEKLEFRLDGLDIEHLSGSLNLGNNFGAHPSVQADDPKPKTNQSADRQPAANQAESSKPAQTGLHRTPTGFRFDNRR
ncbi:hypothetical protein [Cohnella nanjingensis]|uniref:Uncharacterized protein n=1 Tax=Cohnella nanjingensis TaxID=1387779 RepID=A0A7X0VCU3_9BACL|nr:hypothetical protein [Cohnella nanjingensis]MBB6669250.1 hypothetical protein [Cohnella nanjingensis]